MSWVPIPMKFPGTCIICNKIIEKGETGLWSKGVGVQIKHVIDGANAKKLIPIHTLHDEYHKKWHPNVTSVNQHDSINL